MTTRHCLSVCGACCYRSKSDVVFCTIDGIDIEQHAQIRQCPDQRYGVKKYTPRRPKDLLLKTAVKFISRHRTPEDVGLGDTVHRLLGTFGRTFEWAVNQVKVTCGCGVRRESWNQKFPYNKFIESTGLISEADEMMS